MLPDFDTVWTEKYRPERLSQIYGQKPVIERLSAFAREGTIPHLLFAGPAGVGKTTAALALAKELFGKNWKDNFMETNASDERGIDVVRLKIKDFARTKPMESSFKIIFLDECDALTRDAQNALRRTMETYSRSCRFILSCNYSSKIIDPIQSRCAIFRFSPIKKEELFSAIQVIAKEEKLKIDEDALEAIYEISEGDLRKATNTLQAVSVKAPHVTKKAVFEASRGILPEELNELVKAVLSGSFSTAREASLALIYGKGLSSEEITRALHKEFLKSDLADEKKLELLVLLGECDFRLLSGATPTIQLDALYAKISSIMNGEEK